MSENNFVKQESSIEEKKLNPMSGWLALIIGILFIISPTLGVGTLIAYDLSLIHILPTVKSLKLSACENIASNTCGIKFMFLKTINNATNMYATANIGTITSVIFAILWTPPNITAVVNAHNIIPISNLFVLKAALNATVIVFDWTALNTNAKAIVINIENKMCIRDSSKILKRVYLQPKLLGIYSFNLYIQF